MKQRLRIDRRSASKSPDDRYKSEKDRGCWVWSEVMEEGLKDTEVSDRW